MTMQALQDIAICMTIYCAVWVVIFGWKSYTKNC